MSSDPAEPTPPEGLPDELASTLHQLRPEELRRTIIHAQELLNYNHESPSPVEPKPGDDILSVTEHEGYTEVIKYVTETVNGTESRVGPFHYHVTEERHPDGTVKPYWKFIGDINLDDEEKRNS
ncbi:hypothetical protein [Halovivax limisalsi]|uniref:hypothetical protein n=1 Tax=Halovivax limisalsi TaxID=1453760 RepID=UPI001FFCADB7|nr:hypothetical protein [Halovivax limisalsi]